MITTVINIVINNLCYFFYFFTSFRRIPNKFWLLCCYPEFLGCGSAVGLVNTSHGYLMESPEGIFPFGDGVTKTIVCVEVKRFGEKKPKHAVCDSVAANGSVIHAVGECFSHGPGVGCSLASRSAGDTYHPALMTRVLCNDCPISFASVHGICNASRCLRAWGSMSYVSPRRSYLLHIHVSIAIGTRLHRILHLRPDLIMPPSKSVRSRWCSHRRQCPDYIPRCCSRHD